MNSLINIIPFVYANFISTNKIIYYSVNSIYLYYFIYNYQDIGHKLLDNILRIKLYLKDKFYKKNDFVLSKVLLYIDLENNLDVTEYFKKKNIKILDSNLIIQLYHYKKLIFSYHPDIRLKIFYSYKNIDYISYLSYRLNNSMPYPFYSELIMEDYRNDIIYEKYTKNIKKKYFYSLFSMESKDINIVKINNEENRDLLKYMKMVQTPFYDFGILYNNPVKLLWVLYENDIKDFNEFYLKYTNLYLDEEEFELKVHEIKLTDPESIIISERMNNILKIKNMEDLN